MISTPEDMNPFIRTLVDTDRLILKESKASMLTEVFPGSEYGLGVMVTLDDPVDYGHTGKFFGYLSSLYYDPSLSISFATTVKGLDGTYDELYEQYLTQLASALQQSLLN